VRWYLNFDGAWLLGSDANDRLLGGCWRNASGWHPVGWAKADRWGWLCPPMRDPKKAKAAVWAHAVG
jgi:hypothetical protein